MKTLIVFLVAIVAVKAAYQEWQCTNFDHPDYGCSGQCMDYADSNCPGGKTISGKCPTQAGHVKCCFTANTDEKCATYNHPTAGQVGSCVSTSQCPNNFYISQLCPSKASDIKCCFDKPTGTCSGAYQEWQCTNFDHPDYGCSGQCMDYADSNCPGGKTISGKCPTQAGHVKCCFTANTDEKCATYNHPTAGQVGSCVSTSQCPNNFYISQLCPSKASDIKCCFDKPTGTCSGGPVPADCMKCICNVESGCREIGCHWDVNSDSCGPYQIKNDYFEDAKEVNPNLGPDWKSCTKKFACSKDTVQAYMTKYAAFNRLKRAAKCEDFARIHNGGPDGWKSSNTDGYWAKIQAQGCS